MTLQTLTRKCVDVAVVDAYLPVYPESIVGQCSKVSKIACPKRSGYHEPVPEPVKGGGEGDLFICIASVAAPRLRYEAVESTVAGCALTCSAGFVIQLLYAVRQAGDRGRAI